MNKWAYVVRALLIGVACAALQPTQPRSVIAAALLVIAFELTRGKDS